MDIKTPLLLRAATGETKSYVHDLVLLWNQAWGHVSLCGSIRSLPYTGAAVDVTEQILQRPCQSLSGPRGRLKRMAVLGDEVTEETAGFLVLQWSDSQELGGSGEWANPGGVQTGSGTGIYTDEHRCHFHIRIVCRCTHSGVVCNICTFNDFLKQVGSLAEFPCFCKGGSNSLPHSKGK